MAQSTADRRGRPLVIVHVAVALDGATTGFPVKIGRFYELVSRLIHPQLSDGGRHPWCGRSALPAPGNLELVAVKDLDQLAWLRYRVTG